LKPSSSRKADGYRLALSAVNESSLGYTGRINWPTSVSFSSFGDGLDTLAFERSLYVIRKRCEKLVVGKGEADRDYFYFASLSAGPSFTKACSQLNRSMHSTSTCQSQF
jgi:hypothetical protein